MACNIWTKHLELLPFFTTVMALNLDKGYKVSIEENLFGLPSSSQLTIIKFDLLMSYNNLEILIMYEKIMYLKAVSDLNHQSRSTDWESQIMHTHFLRALMLLIKKKFGMVLWHCVINFMRFYDSNKITWNLIFIFREQKGCTQTVW